MIDENQELSNVVESFTFGRTMFTEWMKTNQKSEIARRLTYTQFPTKFVWKSQGKEWVERQKGHSIGRMVYVHPTTGELYYLRLLLNIVKGPTCFEDIRTYEGVIYPTYKEACYARGMLDGDQEWLDAMKEASSWAMPTQLRQLFVTLLMFCEIGNPHQLWKENQKFLGEDIQERQKRILRFPHLHLTEEQIEAYTLFEIEQLLNENGKSLKDYEGVPLPSNDMLQILRNSLILEEMSYDIKALAVEHEKLHQGLNNEKVQIYKDVLKAVYTKSGGVFFLYGHGGTGKTYLYKTIMSKLRSEKKIVLAVASSGIASQLLEGGRTAHSRFKIPINLFENSTCDIKLQTKLADLLQRADLIIWDEAPMAHKHAFEAVDKTLRDIMLRTDPNLEEKVFGGKTILLGGDFRQILPVIQNGTRQDTVMAAINRSYIWEHCTIFRLTKNMRVLNDDKEFADWILSIGDGKHLDRKKEGEIDEDNISIPKEFILPMSENPIQDIFNVTFLEFPENHTKLHYLRERAILTPKNETVDKINEFVMNILPEEEVKYLSADSIMIEGEASSDETALYPVEYLNSLVAQGIPNHELKLKKGVPIMLIRNVNQKLGLCNGTRLIVTVLGKKIIEAEILAEGKTGTKVLIPRIIMSTNDGKWPFVLRRRQYLVRVCYAMTINKSQGQTLNNVGIYLPKPVFAHGQLYVACSRVRSRRGLKIIFQHQKDANASITKNIVYREIFNNLANYHH